jgi:hypothetical protein
LKKAYFKFNIKSNEKYILPQGFVALTDKDILENFHDVYTIGLHRNLDYSQMFNLWEYPSAVYRYHQKSSKRTNGEVYLERFLKNRELGGSTVQEQQSRDPFLTALSLVYFENGKGFYEFYSSLNRKQRDYIREYATREPYTLLDILCSNLCRQTDLSIRAKDLSQLIAMQFKSKYLSIFEFASPNPFYAKLLFVEIEDATILTLFFQLLCFERSKNYTEKNLYQMHKLTEQLMSIKAHNEIERAIKVQVAGISSEEESVNLNFRFSWTKSEVHKSKMIKN